MPETPDIVFAATTPWDGTPLTERHLAAGLAADRRVLYVEPPVSVGRPGWRAAGRTRVVRDGVRVLTPLSLPWRDRPAGWRFSRPLVAGQIRRAAAEAGMHRPLLVEFALHRDLAGRLGERATIAYLKDAGAAAGPLIGVPSSYLQACEDRALARAALVVTPSAELAAEARDRTAADILELAPGCDRQAPALPDTAVAALLGPRIGLVGTLNGRIDWPLLDALAHARPEWSLVLAGPRSRLTDPVALGVLARPNVHELGPVAHADLPRVLAAFDAAIVPYRTADPFNVRSTPLKTLEFLAAGLAVVATPIPAHRRMAPAIRLADDAPQFAVALAQELDGDDRERRAARRRLAGANDWAQRCTVLDGALRRVWAAAA